jgi:hypothetical protein
MKINDFVRVRDTVSAVYQETQEPLANIYGRIVEKTKTEVIVYFPDYGVALPMSESELRVHPWLDEDNLEESQAKKKAMFRWYKSEKVLTKFNSYPYQYIVFTGGSFIYISRDDSIPHGYWGRWYTGLSLSRAKFHGGSLTEVASAIYRSMK